MNISKIEDIVGVLQELVNSDLSMPRIVRQANSYLRFADEQRLFNFTGNVNFAINEITHLFDSGESHEEKLIDFVNALAKARPDIAEKYKLEYNSEVGPEQQSREYFIEALRFLAEAIRLEAQPHRRDDFECGREITLQPAHELAWQSYKYAEAKISQSDPTGRITDKLCYEYLKNRGTEGNYQLPAYQTWKRYVVAARNFYNENINNRRAGREGRSIVKKNEI